MYFENLQFTRKPFSNTADPDFYYLTDTARRAYHRITQAVDQRAPYAVLSGDPGTGKTTLLNRLMTAADPHLHWIFITQTSLNWQEMLFAMGRSLKIPGITSRTTNLSDVIARRLKAMITQGMAPVLIIDEAQCLKNTALKKLFTWRTWLNSQAIGLSIVLSGQTEMLQILIDFKSPDFNIGSCVHSRLKKLSLAESRAMIAHRLQMAGYSGPTLFSDRTLRTIFSLSSGIPRRVITIWDLSLFTAAARAGQSVSPKDIRDISKYILRTAVDPPEKNRLPNATSVRPKSMYLRQSAPRVSGRWSLANPSTWRQWLAPLRNEIADQWKYVSALQSRSWPWIRTIADLVKHTPTSWPPLFRPWGYAIACPLIVLVIGYVQLQAPTLESYPTFAVDSRPADHASVQRFKIETITITSEVEPYSQALAVQNLVDSGREGSNISSPKNEGVEKALNITEISALPDSRAIEDTTDKEKNVQALLLSKATVIKPENVKNDHQIRASGVSAVNQGPNQTKTPIPIPDTSILTKQASVTSISPPPTEQARVTVKRIKSAVPKKTAQQIKPNLATKVLSRAIQNGRIDSVRKALSDGADPNVVLSKDKTALTAAIDRDHFEIVQALLDQGATIDRPAPTGDTALMKAAWAGHTAMTELLLNRGARVNLQNRDGWTPLFYASIMGRSDIVKTLLNRGARWNLSDRDGRTPLMAAAWNGHINIVRHLLSAGADPNRKDRDGWTPLMFASFEGHARVGEYLLSHGADLSVKNNSGRTSGNLATQQGHSELFAMISNHNQQ